LPDARRASEVLQGAGPERRSAQGHAREIHQRFRKPDGSLTMKQLTQHKLRRVYEYLALRCPWAEVTARLVVSTGLPAKELRELTWEQVDFEGKFIRTKDDVYVPINGQTIRTMRRITPFGDRVLTMPSGR